MSGFAGIIRSDGAFSLRNDLNSLAAGLDAVNVGAPRLWHDGHAGMVFCPRIVTPQDAKDTQPFVSRDGDRTTVFDGRLDEREYLAHQLNRPFDPVLPDSAWVAAALERWETEAPAKLLGDFALAHWDERRQRLLLARDRTGQRSLYYHRGERFVAFATTMRALLALREVPRELDDTGLADFLALNPFNASGTLYRGIQRVPAAHYVVFEHAAVSTHRHWRLDPDRTLRFAHDDDYVEAARALLDQAVASRLRVTGPIVGLTSGGLDSAGVLATAARLSSPATVHGLTAVPPEGFRATFSPGAYPDERPYVAALQAMHDNLRIQTLAANDVEGIEDDARALFGITGQPMRNVYGIAWLGPAFRRARELGAHSILGGDFGNMSLSYSGLDQIEAMRAGKKWATWSQAVWQHARFNGQSPWRALASRLAPRRKLGHPSGPGWQKYSALAADFGREIDLDRHFAQCGFDPGDRNPGSSYAERLSQVLDAGSIADDGRSALSALTGLDMSDPLADTRLLEFCAGIPDNQYLRRGETRFLARRVLSDRLPQIIVRNPRRGLQCPEWFERLDARREQIGQEVERLAHSPIASRALDVDRLRRLVADWPSDADEARVREDGYRFVLTRAAHVGQFIRWVEGAND